MVFFFFKQKTAYEMRISDWSSDVCSSDLHVVRPDEEAERADDGDRPDHHPVAEDVLAGVDADEIGDDAEGGQRDDIDLGVAEEPEEMLEEDRRAALIAHVLVSHGHDGRHEEAGAGDDVQKHHDAGDEQGREGEKSHEDRKSTRLKSSH